MYKQLSAFIITLICITNVFANTFYRHPPFTLNLTAQDKIYVDYDFTDKKGISCMSPMHPETWIDFSYKGRDKSARLPVTLQSQHVPNASSEELADASGTLAITMSSHPLIKSHQIHCEYRQ
jgi:hypothetical protein